MNFTGIAGFAIVWFFILLGMGFDKLGSFIDIPSIQIVVVGTIGAVFVAYPFSTVKSVPLLLKNAFNNPKDEPVEAIKTLVEFADQARREGILALEEKAQKLEDPFLKKGIGLAVDGTEPELIRDILKTEMDYIEERHAVGAEMLEFAATLAPAMGMIGTLVGLILMLGNMSDVDSIGPNMAVALITTLYGSMMANAFCLPIANILKRNSNKEIMVKGMMLEGIMSLQTGDNPRIVQQKLAAFLDPASRADAMKEA